jgi:hypothetical protein
MPEDQKRALISAKRKAKADTRGFLTPHEIKCPDDHQVDGEEYQRK